MKKSPPKPRRTWSKTHHAAVKQYGEGARSHRTAFASLKQGFEKVGDHWEPKKRRGPSDPRSTKTTRQKRQGKGETFGGVDLYGHTREELYDRAKRLDISGRSKMTKKELARAIARAH